MVICTCKNTKNEIIINHRKTFSWVKFQHRNFLGCPLAKNKQHHGEKLQWRPHNNHTEWVYIVDLTLDRWKWVNVFTCSHPISFIFFGVFFSMNCFVISCRLPGFSVNVFKSDSQPGASSPVIDRCITTIPALSSSAASILCDFSRSSVDRSIWHLPIKTNAKCKSHQRNKYVQCRAQGIGMLICIKLHFK